MSAHTQASSPGVYYDPRWYANASPYIVPNGQPAPVTTAQYPYYPVPAIYPYAHAPYGYYPAMPEKMIPQPATTSADPSTADRPAPAAKRPKISTITSGVWPSSSSSQSPATNPDTSQKDVVVPQYPITLQHPQPYTPPSIPFAYYYHPYLSASQPAAPQPAAPQRSDVSASKAEALGHAHTSSGVQVPHKDMSPPPIVTLTPPEDSRTISASTPPPPIVTVTPPEESPSAASGTDVSPPIQDHAQPPEERRQTAVESSFPEQAPTDPEDPVADTVLSPSKIALPLSPITNHQTMASYSAQAMPSISSAMADLSISEERETVDAQKKADVPTVVDLRHSHPRPSTGPSLPASIEAAPVLREGPMDLSLLTHSESERKPKTSRTRPSRSGSGPVYTAVTQPSDLSSKEHRPVARARTFPYPVAPNAPPLHFLPPPPPVLPPPYPKPQGALQTATSKLASKLRLRRQPPPIIPIPLNPLITAMPPFPSPTGPAALKSSMSGARQPGDDSTRPPSLTRSEYTTSTGTVPTPTSAAFPSSPTIQSPSSSSSSSKRKPRASRPGMVISFNSPGEKYYGFMNTSPYKIYYNKRLYPTAEHLFQAFKFLSPRPGGLGLGGALSERIIGLGSGGIGARIAERIRSIPDPMEASSEAAMNSEYQRDDWEEIATEKMEEVLYMKFTQHDGLRAELVSTHPAQLVWASPRDSYYGAGPNGKGRNELGRLLMHVRDRLKAEGGL